MRIISGSARGRRIETIPGDETRPTSDRVRESIFGMIQLFVPEARVLDLFAGSGAMAIEALSRGAAGALLNDRNMQCVKVIQKNLAALGLDKLARVRCGDYETCLEAAVGEKFDLIFLDPPYGGGIVQRALERICTLNLLSERGRVVAEHEAKLRLELPQGVSAVSRQYGKTGVTVVTLGQGIEDQN